MKIIIRRPRRPILAPPRRPSRPARPALATTRARAPATRIFSIARRFFAYPTRRRSSRVDASARASRRASRRSRLARPSIDRSLGRRRSSSTRARRRVRAPRGGAAAVDALAKPSCTHYVLYAQFADVAKNRDRARSIAPAFRAIDGASIAIDDRSTARRSTRDVAAARRTRADDRAGPPLRRAHRSRVMAVGKNKRMSKGKKGGKKKACVRDATANDREATREATGRGSIDATGERGTRDDDDDGRRRGG